MTDVVKLFPPLRSPISRKMCDIFDWIKPLEGKSFWSCNEFAGSRLPVVLYDERGKENVLDGRSRQRDDASDDG